MSWSVVTLPATAVWMSTMFETLLLSVIVFLLQTTNKVQMDKGHPSEIKSNQHQQMKTERKERKERQMTSSDGLGERREQRWAQLCPHLIFNLDPINWCELISQSALRIYTAHTQRHFRPQHKHKRLPSHVRTYTRSPLETQRHPCEWAGTHTRTLLWTKWQVAQLDMKYCPIASSICFLYPSSASFSHSLSIIHPSIIILSSLPPLSSH